MLSWNAVRNFQTDVGTEAVNYHRCSELPLISFDITHLGLAADKVGLFWIWQPTSHFDVREADRTEKEGWLKCCFMATENIGLLGMGSQDDHLNFHTAPPILHERGLFC